MKFDPIPDAKYLYDYEEILSKVKEGTYNELDTYRELFFNDLWFVVYFILKVPPANHPWVVDVCKEVQQGPKNRTLDLWAREHFKTTILTTAEPIQNRIKRAILEGFEETTGIFAYNRPVAKAFLRGIKNIFEQSDLLKDMFPQVCWKEPHKEAPKWSEDDGLVLKRTGMQKESCFEAYGLIEGMPTSKHFSYRIYDDISTLDLVETEASVAKVKSRFYMSANLGTMTGKHRVTGTIYDFNDILVELLNKKDTSGNDLYHVRKKPATHDGEFNGEPVLLPHERNEELKVDPIAYATQQLIDPRRTGEIRKITSELLEEVLPHDLPKHLFKFFTIDPAGDKKTIKRARDSWAMMICGVRPYMDELGQSDLYILDMIIEPMAFDDAMKNIVDMFLRNGIVYRVGIESIGSSMIDIHVANALRAKGRIVTLENENLVKLHPAGRKKAYRIESALSWPLSNGKIKVSKGIPENYRKRLKEEMDKFPFWHDDALDALSYQYDLFKDFRFALFKPQESKEDAYERKYQEMLQANSGHGWMTV
jgi:hypothetical protein